MFAAVFSYHVGYRTVHLPDVFCSRYYLALVKLIGSYAFSVDRSVLRETFFLPPGTN
jgi:hypothetical protein